MADKMDTAPDPEEKDLVPNSDADAGVAASASDDRSDDQTKVMSVNQDGSSHLSTEEHSKEEAQADLSADDAVSIAPGVADPALHATSVNPPQLEDTPERTGAETTPHSLQNDNGGAAERWSDTQTYPAAPASRTKPSSSSEGNEPVSSQFAKPGLELLYDVELDATLQFGSREMMLRDVLELGPGDVVELDRHMTEPVDLVVGDRIVARGEVVVTSGNFALRVTEVATPQMRLESIRCLF